MLAALPLAFLLFQAPNEPKLATVEGKVTHAGSKTAIRKAKVNLVAIGFEGGTNVETADDGKFVLKDVKPGRYRIRAEKAGYETTAYGARKPGEGLGQVIRVDPGAALTGIDITVPKHGVIAGKILDVEGEPVPKVLVMALGNVYQTGKRIRIPRGTVPAISNDLGEFRIGELPPGSYIVCAVPAGFYGPNPNAKESKPTAEDAMVTTCFPNVGQMSEASALEIQDASELPGMDIRLAKTRTVTVSGQISGVPPNAGQMTILNLNTDKNGPIGNALNPRAFIMSAEGKFEFKNVPPGSYILHTLPTGLGNVTYVVKQRVDIGDQPVTGLVVNALIPFEIPAKINAEPGPELKLPSIRMVLTPADGITSTLAMASANADGKVTLANVVPGRHKVQFTGIPSTHYVREIRVGERVADGDELEIAAAGTEITVALAIGKGEVNGAARNDKGDPVVAAHIALIPEPRRPFRIRATRTDQNGAFKFQNVPPGEYQAVALESVEAGALEDEEVVKQLTSKLKRVKVGEDAQSLELAVQPPVKLPQ